MIEPTAMGPGVRPRRLFEKGDLPMKRIVICCDGTWQSMKPTEVTNVAQVARSVMPTAPDGTPQVVYYASGVGVSRGGNSALAGAFGWGLDENLAEAYKFIALNYSPGDELYFFGFSRGAYTVRSLCGLLRKCGILKRSEAHRATEALAVYRNKDDTADGDNAIRFRAAFAQAWPRIGKQESMRTLMDAGASTLDLRIRYLGVWDTVGALGIPSSLPGALKLNKKYQFHDDKLSRAVEYARHAVAIDESRNAFVPTLWGNVDEINGRDWPERVQQKWFPGDHGSVGGGGDTQALSAAALKWVVEGAEAAGLVFDRQEQGVLTQTFRSIDVTDGELMARRPRFSAMSVAMKLVGGKTRQGLDRFDQLHGSARFRGITTRQKGKRTVPAYQPKQLRALGRWLDVWRTYVGPDGGGGGGGG